MLLVTFHETINNINGYDETHPGSPPIGNLLEIPSDQLSELRGMLLANGLLYVVNGGKHVSNILCFTPDPNNAYHFQQPAVFTPAGLTAIDHPFDCTFRIVQTSALPSQDEMQIWYVSNQDTNVVAVLAATPPYTSAQASSGEYLTDLLAALKTAGSSLAKDGFMPGTFVGTSDVGAEIPTQTTVDPAWGGLTPSFSSSASSDDAADGGKKKKDKEKVQNSVRGVVCHNGVLYVADEAGNAVRMYDPETGVPWGSTAVNGPVHLMVNNGTLYVTSTDSVLSGPCVTPPANPPEPPADNQFLTGQVPPPYPAPPAGYTNSVTLTLTDLGLGLTKNEGPAGMTFDASGNLYVAARKTKEIYKFKPNSSQTKGAPPFVPSKHNPIFQNMGDNPEFLLWTATQP